MTYKVTTSKYIYFFLEVLFSSKYLTWFGFMHKISG